MLKYYLNSTSCQGFYNFAFIFLFLIYTVKQN